jgi:hypothetical protein
MPGARRRTANPAGVLDQGLQPRLLPGGDGCGTGHLIHESQGEQRPQSAAHRCRLWQRAPACKASWVSAWRRSTQPDPSTSSGESGRAAVQRHCDVGHNKGLLGGCAACHS